ncbi:MAG: GNAT family N-acetyltransferase [Clostridiales bacterium]|nr:GNAT family N-acetyltransferase [Clostridiales bacterium]
MRLTLKKEITNTNEVIERIEHLKMEDDELKSFLLNTLPVVMEDVIDPDMDPNKPEIYVNNLFCNRLGDFKRRYIITITNDGISALLLGIRKDDYLHILTLGVKKDLRRNQYGEELLKFCMNDMINESISKVVLNTHSDNVPAINLYNKMGFNIIEE